MPTWYTGKLAYKQEDENGRLKAVTQTHLIDALSFTEAEARMAALTVSGVQDFTVKAIVKTQFSDVFLREDNTFRDYWYAVKVAFLSIDERTGKEKRVVNTMLVLADDVADALRFIEKELSKWLIAVVVESVALTPYYEVHPYQKAEEPAPTPES